MKNFVLLLFFLVVPSILSAQELIAGPACVRDGDSIFVGGKISSSGWCVGGHEIRLMGIDAPEWKQLCINAQGKSWYCGQVAAQKLKTLIEQSQGQVSCRVTSIGRYGRTIAVCYAGQLDIGRAMIRSGYALSYLGVLSPYYPDQNQAKSQKLGLWSGTFISPWRFRKSSYGQ